MLVAGVEASLAKRERWRTALEEEGSSKNCQTFHCSLLMLFGICGMCICEIIAASEWR